jgi:hypothetical protein
MQVGQACHPVYPLLQHVAPPACSCGKPRHPLPIKGVCCFRLCATQGGWAGHLRGGVILVQRQHNVLEVEGVHLQQEYSKMFVRVNAALVSLSAIQCLQLRLSQSILGTVLLRTQSLHQMPQPPPDR